MRWSVPILCLLYINSFSQQASIDSLKKVLLNTKGGYVKSKHLMRYKQFVQGV